MTEGVSTGWFLAPLAVTLGPGGIALVVGVYAFEIFTLAAKAYTKIQKINRIIKNVNENIQTTCAELGLEATSGIQALRRQIAEIEQQFTIKSAYFSKLGIMDRSSKLDEKKLKIIINKKEQVQKLKNLIEIKEKVTLKKSYLLHDQLSKVGIATALFAGIALALTGPIGAAIGASLVVLTCTVQYWVNHHYLPKKEVQLAYDPLELLHAKLNKHTHTQLEALTKKISHLVDGLEKQQTLEKITAYRKSQTALNDWKETPVKECKKLYQAMNLVMNASKIRRNRDVTPASYKALKTDIKHFFTSWRNEYKEQQDEFYVIAQKFVLSSKTTDQASLKIDIVSEVTTGSCLFFAKAEGTNTTQAQAYAFGGSVAF
uniref:hypothetical protein n=1 Tax=Piscirickettsia salmonis TaxID=1238 RepID=UPI0039F65693